MDEPTTVADLLRLLQDHYDANGQPVAAMLRYQTPAMVSFFGERDVEGLNFADFEKFKAHRIAQGRKPKTVNNELGYLARANRLGRRAGLCRALWDIEKFRIGVTNARTDFITPEQLRAIVRGLPWDIQDVVEFAYHTGWRRGEILGLEWDGVSQEEGFIYLEARRSKNRHARKTPITAPLEKVLRRRLRMRAGPLVFHRQGRPIRDFSRSWKTATRRAGCPDVVFHACRRSFVRNCIRSGVDRDVAMKLSGHRSNDIFRRYNIVDERDLQEGARQVGDYVVERDPGGDGWNPPARKMAPSRRDTGGERRAAGGAS